MVLKRKINGDTWTVGIKTMDAMAKLDGCDSDTLGVTYAEEKEIWLRDDSVTEKIVRHELFHAYFHYLHIDSELSSAESIEETMAQFIEHRGDMLIKQGRRVWRDLKKLQK